MRGRVRRVLGKPYGAFTCGNGVLALDDIPKGGPIPFCLKMSFFGRFYSDRAEKMAEIEEKESAESIDSPNIELMRARTG